MRRGGGRNSQNPNLKSQIPKKSSNYLPLVRNYAGNAPLVPRRWKGSREGGEGREERNRSVWCQWQAQIFIMPVRNTLKGGHQTAQRPRTSQSFSFDFPLDSHQHRIRLRPSAGRPISNCYAICGKSFSGSKSRSLIALVTSLRSIWPF